MSKRHQHSRRKSYGRRQHELRERADRGDLSGRSQPSSDDRAEASPVDFAFLDPRAGRLRFAMGD